MHTIERILFRSMLFLIDLFLAFAPERAAKNLWDVMSALRGPDDSSLLYAETVDTYRLKSLFTCPIRSAALPITRCREYRSRDATHASFGYRPLPSLDGELPQTHFHWHARAAISALTDAPLP